MKKIKFLVTVSFDEPAAAPGQHDEHFTEGDVLEFLGWEPLAGVDPSSIDKYEICFCNLRTGQEQDLLHSHFSKALKEGSLIPVQPEH